MNLNTIAAASYEEQKYFFSDEFSALPKETKDEIKILCVTTAQKLCCTFIMVFDEECEVYFQTLPQKEAFAFDEISAGLEISRLSKVNRELLLSLKTWLTAKAELA